MCILTLHISCLNVLRLNHRAISVVFVVATIILLFSIYKSIPTFFNPVYPPPLAYERLFICFLSF